MIKNKLSIEKREKELIIKMCNMVMENTENFIKEMEIKIDNKKPLSITEQQLIAEYTLAYIQVRAILRSI